MSYETLEKYVDACIENNEINDAEIAGETGDWDHVDWGKRVVSVEIF